MKRVLLIEDSATQAEQARAILESAGFAVQVARNGRAGLELFARGELDLVITDIVMPELSGYEVCRAIKADPARRRTPVVLLTTLGDPLDIMHALECGADSFITKGQAPDALIARLESLLETRALRDGRSSEEGVEVSFEKKTFTVTSDREQVLDFLLATFEDIVQTNRELETSRRALAREQEALVRAQRLKEELGALLVHDLKGPAAGIMMIARARLRSHAPDSDEGRYWTSVMSSAEVINRMVLNLLDITRGEEGTLQPKTAGVDLREVLEEVRQLMTPLAEDRRQTVRIDGEGVGAGRLLADREMLRRVLQNLVDNALRYGPSASTVSMSARREGGHVELRVADEGAGIPKELRQRVFDKYVRLDRNVQDAGAGRGLGLVFCRLAAEAMNGAIWIEDNEPSGTVFVLRFPAIPAA